MFALPLPTILRPLAAGTFVSALGNGAWYASWALFLVRVLELPIAEAGAALTVADVALIAANALTYLVYAGAAARLPRVATAPHAERSGSRGALRDGPYVALAA